MRSPSPARPSVRPSLFVLLSALALSAGPGCGERNPVCNDCPDLQGAWTLQFELSEPEPCADGTAVGSGTLDLTQVGSSLRGTFGGVELQGTIFQSWDFSLNGSAPSADEGALEVLHSLTGKFARGQPSLQTGDRLMGTYSATSPGGCTASGSYVATRVQ